MKQLFFKKSDKVKGYSFLDAYVPINGRTDIFALFEEEKGEFFLHIAVNNSNEDTLIYIPPHRMNHKHRDNMPFDIKNFQCYEIPNENQWATAARNTNRHMHIWTDKFGIRKSCRVRDFLTGMGGESGRIIGQIVSKQRVSKTFTATVKYITELCDDPVQETTTFKIDDLRTQFRQVFFCPYKKGGKEFRTWPKFKWSTWEGYTKEEFVHTIKCGIHGNIQIHESKFRSSGGVCPKCFPDIPIEYIQDNKSCISTVVESDNTEKESIHNDEDSLVDYEDYEESVSNYGEVDEPDKKKMRLDFD